MNEYAQMIRKGVDFFGRYTTGVRFTDLKRTARFINVGTPPVTCEELEEARRLFNDEALRNIEKHGLDFVSEVVRLTFPYISRQRLFNLFACKVATIKRRRSAAQAYKHKPHSRL